MAKVTFLCFLVIFFCRASSAIYFEEDESVVEGIGCPYLYMKNGDYCYRYFAEPALNFKSAESACIGTGTKCHLASIANEDENNFLFALSGNGPHTWIGLDDMREEGKFEWTDGTSVEYVKWLVGQPDNAGGAEDCVHFYENNSGGWNDNKCGEAYGYLCKCPFRT